MHEDQHAELLDPGKEFFKTRARQIEPSDVGADLDAAKAVFFHRAFDFGDGHAAVLQRHRAHAHQPVGMLRHQAGNMVVDDPCAVARNLCRRGIDEVTGRRRDHLDIDPQPIHVGQPRRHVGQLRKVDRAALLADAFRQIVDMRVGVGVRAAAGNARRLQHQRIRLRHHAVTVNVDGAPFLVDPAPDGVPGSALGRGTASHALVEHAALPYSAARARPLSGEIHSSVVQPFSS